ncbi:MAG: hypothetical protein IJ608_04265 [Lachnospiraceae bacterium]|nr:hypothetical protein [Lachnospiraceae bacterium]
MADNEKLNKIIDSDSVKPTLTDKKDKKTAESKKKKQRIRSNPFTITNISAHNARTLLVKCYEEQIPMGLQDFKTHIRKISKNEMEVIAIIHNKDEKPEGVWLSALEKPHIHIVARLNQSLKVSTILNKLGVAFRNPVDECLILHDALQTVNEGAGGFPASVVYLTHETKRAIIDGKYVYDVSECFSNLSIDEIMDIRSAYAYTVTREDLMMLKNTAYQKGYDCKSFDEWWERELPQNFYFDNNIKKMKKNFQNQYKYGMNKRYEDNKHVVRCCIFLKGSADFGKTYNSEKALKERLKLKTYCVSGGKTGKFDRLTPAHEALVVNDYPMENLLNMCDNEISDTYRRNSDNPLYTGKYIIITGNKSIEEWILEIYPDLRNKPEELKAIKSRFYEVECVEVDGRKLLNCVSASDRGTPEEVEERDKLYCDFRDAFEACIREYKKAPKKQRDDLSRLNCHVDEKGNIFNPFEAKENKPKEEKPISARVIRNPKTEEELKEVLIDNFRSFINHKDCESPHTLENSMHFIKVQYKVEDEIKKLVNTLYMGDNEESEVAV